MERIFSNAGIQIGWDGASGLQLTVVLQGSAAYQFDGLNQDVAGFALGNDGQGARRAYVFFDRVKGLALTLLTSARNCQGTLNTKQIAALNRERTQSLILGHVMAHEVGHLMLPHGAHTPAGIMSPRIESDRFGQALGGDLLFTANQSELMRAVLHN
jgi:hypothetical protein